MPFHDHRPTRISAVAAALAAAMLTACLDVPLDEAADDASALGVSEAEVLCQPDNPGCYEDNECADICTSASACSTKCDINGVPRSCGVFGTCKACSTCTTGTPCDETCRQGGLVKTCGSTGVCQSCSTTVCAGTGSCYKDCRDPAAGGALVDCNEWGSTQSSYGSARGDWDLDALDDDVEDELARRFYPDLSMTIGNLNGCASERALYYGHGNVLPLPPTTVPYMVNRLVGASAGCAYGECIVIIYGIPFSWDAGDILDLGYGQVGIREHRGDSEMYAVVLAHRPQDGSLGWGTTSTTSARRTPSVWRAVKHFASAHMCEPSSWGDSPDSSRFVSEGPAGRTTPVRLWSAAGKHALYFSASACDAGGWYGSDSCQDSIVIDRSRGLGVLTNAGSQACHEGFTTTIKSPAWQCDQEPFGSELVFSGAKFGEAAPWSQKLNPATLRWNTETYTCY